jgi:hypothetical protein
MKRPDGKVRWIHDRAFPVRNPAGEVYQAVEKPTIKIEHWDSWVVNDRCEVTNKTKSMLRV